MLRCPLFKSCVVAAVVNATFLDAGNDLGGTISMPGKSPSRRQLSSHSSKKIHQLFRTAQLFFVIYHLGQKLAFECTKKDLILFYSLCPTPSSMASPFCKKHHFNESMPRREQAGTKEETRHPWVGVGCGVSHHQNYFW